MVTNGRIVFKMGHGRIQIPDVAAAKHAHVKHKIKYGIDDAAMTDDQDRVGGRPLQYLIHKQPHPRPKMGECLAVGGVAHDRHKRAAALGHADELDRQCFWRIR